jgi:GNAT superfamily N-acetyltransferase
MVAGKVVPDAPARRRGIPAASVRELVVTAARGWPPVETEQLGGWTLRASAMEPPGSGSDAGKGHAVRGEGFTARANSVLPLGDPGTSHAEAIERAQRWYEARGLVPRVQVTTGGERTDELLAAELERRGWSGEKYSLLRIAALAPLADREPDSRVQLSRTPDAGWLSLYRRVGELPGTALKVLTGGPSVWFATVPGDAGSAGNADAGSPGAIGRCVIDGRWAGFAAVEVAPDRRRQGLATTVMAELARTALAEGASAAYLQVEGDNAAARALYDALGFADHHSYHYRRAPQD